ncbi:MAG: hypothetical protein ACR2NY_02515 [Alphaproteobacteria bacterium]
MVNKKNYNMNESEKRTYMLFSRNRRIRQLTFEEVIMAIGCLVVGFMVGFMGFVVGHRLGEDIYGDFLAGSLIGSIVGGILGFLIGAIFAGIVIRSLAGGARLVIYIVLTLLILLVLLFDFFIFYRLFGNSAVDYISDMIPLGFW